MLNTFSLTLPWLEGSVITYGSILMVAAGAHPLVCAQPHRLRAACLCHRRRPRGGPAFRHQHQPDRCSQIYTLAGLICAIAAWVLIGRIGGVSPQAGRLANLDSITAVVIGGTSLFGGRGSIVGTIFGALIVGVFRNGLALSGARCALAGLHGRRADHLSPSQSTSGSERCRRHEWLWTTHPHRPRGPGQALWPGDGARPCRLRALSQRNPRASSATTAPAKSSLIKAIWRAR